MVNNLNWLKIFLLSLFAGLFIITWNTKFDTFPITKVEGDIEESYQQIQEFTNGLIFDEQVQKLKDFKYSYDIGNTITLPNVFLKRKSGDCDDFQLTNQFIQKHYGFKDVYIVYMKVGTIYLHYSTIIKVEDGYKQIDYHLISQTYGTLDILITNFHERLYNNKITVIKMVTFEEFLKILNSW